MNLLETGLCSGKISANGLAYAAVTVFAVQGTYLIGEVKVIYAKAAFADHARAFVAGQVGAVNALV